MCPKLDPNPAIHPTTNGRRSIQPRVDESYTHNLHSTYMFRPGFPGRNKKPELSPAEALDTDYAAYIEILLWRAKMGRRINFWCPASSAQRSMLSGPYCTKIVTALDALR